MSARELDFETRQRHFPGTGTLSFLNRGGPMQREGSNVGESQAVAALLLVAIILLVGLHFTFDARISR